MTEPTTQNYLDLAAWTYGSGMTAGTPDSDYTAFAVDGRHYASQNDFDAYAPRAGFYGAAYSIGSGADESVVIGFEGTNTADLATHPVFAYNEIKADYGLYQEGLPTALKLAARFARAVIRTAEAEGIPEDHIYLTGHSLGAAEAEYADVKTGLQGVTFGTPGISTNDVPPGSASGLTNYVERGDPVGNYAYTGPRSPEAQFIYSNKIQHFGETQYLGSPLDALPLRAASAQWATGTAAGKAQALETFLLAEKAYHPLTTYAASLGLSGGTAPGGPSTVSTAELLQVISHIAAQDGGSAAASATASEPVGGLAVAASGTGSPSHAGTVLQHAPSFI